MVWHEALWATMRKYIINVNIIRIIEYLYDKAQGALLFSGSTSDWFRTTVGYPYQPFLTSCWRDHV